MTTGDHSDLIEQLRVIAETLAERGMALLREAIDSGSGTHPVEEKKLTQARRAVEKAISVLGGTSLRDD